MRAISLEARANRIASFCESFSVGSTQSILPTSSSERRSAGTGDGVDSPNSTLMKIDCSDSVIFSILSIVNFILYPVISTGNRGRSAVGELTSCT